jgi:hypothetical protein
MSGYITKTEVEKNAELVRELYGEAVYQAALVAPATETFLGLLAKLGKV